MKTLVKISILTIVALIEFGCVKSVNNHFEEDECDLLIFNNIEQTFNLYSNKLKKINYYYKYEKQNSNDTRLIPIAGAPEQFEEYAVETFPVNVQLIEDIEYSIDEVNEIFGTNKTSFTELKDEIAAISLVILAIKEDALQASITRGGSFVDCFNEASGIAAGIAIITGLTGQTLSKTAIKALVKKVVVKVGARTIGGIGLALLAAEIIWCMNSN